MKFRDEYYFLSNMYPVGLKINGITYKCVESAFQSFKSKDKNVRLAFSNLNGYEAKKLGKQIELREDWNEIKLQIMYLLVQAKFQNPVLKEKLLQTKDIELVEDNTWNDRYWGKCQNKGMNHLGIILMKVRDEIKVES